MTQDTDADYNGIQLRIGSRKFALAPDEADRALSALLSWKTAEQLAWEARQREAGQVWTATYYRYGCAQTETDFSLEDVVGFLRSGAEAGDLTSSGGSILCPDGTVIDGAELSDLVYGDEDDVAGVSR